MSHNAYVCDLKSLIKFLLPYLACCHFAKGPFKYYVMKEVNGWDQKMAIFDYLQ